MIIPNPVSLLKVPIVLISLLLTSTLAFSDTYTVRNTNASGDDSLRWAINSANAESDLDLIDFNIPGAGPHTIQIQSTNELPWPEIEESVVIDGYTQPGAAPAHGRHPAILLIEIDGSSIDSDHNVSCLTLHGDDNTVRGLVINRCDDAGINIDSPNGGNVIEGNYIGTDVTGTNALGNDEHGVRIWASPNNRIGGTTPAERNIISGNTYLGVEILLPESVLNQVEGNYIGVDASGTAGLGNGAIGVHIKEEAGDNTIGPDNVISDNGYEPGTAYGYPGGIYLDGTVGTVTGNMIVANLIGTDAFGRDGLGNSTGIEIVCGDDNTLKGNVVSSSANNGLRIRNSEDNTFQENTAVGNGRNGFRLTAIDTSLCAGTASSNNLLKENVATENNFSGFSVHEDAVDNTFKENDSTRNGGYGYYDVSSGAGTSDTANIYEENTCKANSAGGSDPEGLCSPKN